MLWGYCSAWRGALCAQVGGARCADVVAGASSFRELTGCMRSCLFGGEGTIMLVLFPKQSPGVLGGKEKVAMQWFLMVLWAIWTWSQDRAQARLKDDVCV